MIQYNSLLECLVSSQNNISQYSVLTGTCSQARLTCGGNSGITLTSVLFSLRMFPQLLFQGVSPVSCLCSLTIAHWIWALTLGSSSGFPMGLVLAGGSSLPPPPLPNCQSLLGMVACNYCPLCWTSQYKIVGWCYNLYCEDFRKWYVLPKMLLHQGWCLAECELVVVLPFVLLKLVIVIMRCCKLWFFVKVLRLVCYILQFQVVVEDLLIVEQEVPLHEGILEGMVNLPA